MFGEVRREVLGEEDSIISDAHNHASTIDGMRMWRHKAADAVGHDSLARKMLVVH